MRTLLATLFVCLAAQAQNPAANLTVDVNANRRAINPNVYGLAFGTTAQLQDLNVPLNRYGGNNTSRYNWQINGDNRGQDWYFESIGDTSAWRASAATPSSPTRRAGGAQAMITIPMIGWIAKLGPNRGKLASFSQAKYGAQTGNDWQWFPDAGNGILQSTGQHVTGQRSERRQCAQQLGARRSSGCSPSSAQCGPGVWRRAEVLHPR